MVYNSHGPFLPTSQLSCMDFAWTTIKEAAKDVNDPIIMDAFGRVSKDDITKKKLMKFVSNTFII